MTNAPIGKTPALIGTGAAVLTALLIGSHFGPGPNRPGAASWYAHLDKPAYTPPGPVFGVVWPVLGALMWLAGYRLAVAEPRPARAVALGAWLLNVIGIGAYPAVFFGRKQPAAGLAITGAMLGSAKAQVLAASRVDRPAALASLPFLAWLAFAALLGEEVWRRNR